MNSVESTSPIDLPEKSAESNSIERSLFLFITNETIDQAAPLATTGVYTTVEENRLSNRDSDGSVL